MSLVFQPQDPVPEHGRRVLQRVPRVSCMCNTYILLQAAGKRSYAAGSMVRQSAHKLQATSECSKSLAWSTAHCNILPFPWTFDQTAT